MVDIDFVCSREWDDFCFCQWQKNQNSDYILLFNHQFLKPIDQVKTNQSFYKKKFNLNKPSDTLSDQAVLDIREYCDKDTFFQVIKSKLKLKIMRMTLHIQQPGKIIPIHYDRNRTLLTENMDYMRQNQLGYTDIKKFIYFFDDRDVGHFFGVGNSTIDWKAGDMIEFPWFMPHGTANVSKKPRHILSIAGCK